MARPIDPLKAYRDERGLSQQDLADKLGISRQMVGFLESGDRPYTALMCLLIEKKLGIPRAVCNPSLFAKAA